MKIVDDCQQIDDQEFIFCRRFDKPSIFMSNQTLNKVDSSSYSFITVLEAKTKHLELYKNTWICEACGGLGIDIYDIHRCSICDGDGHISASIELDNEVPF